MPDQRAHRGAHPQDAELFAPRHWPALQRATAELGWLLDRGYAWRSSLALVGDRHGLTQRQRLAVARCACSAAQRQRRQAHELPPEQLAGAAVAIDGYNLLITIEAALAGGILLRGRDGCCRDLASLHGSYRKVEETRPALELIGRALASWRVAAAHWVLDRPVGNSGRLKALIEAVATAAGWSWDVELAPSPDQVLSRGPAVVLSADSVVLDRCAHWFNAAARIVADQQPAATWIDLSGDAT